MKEDVETDIIKVLFPAKKERGEPDDQVKGTLVAGMLGTIEDIKYRTEVLLRKKEVHQAAVIGLTLLLPILVSIILSERNYQEVSLGKSTGIFPDLTSFTKLFRSGY